MTERVAFAKVRGRIRREIAKAEDEEHEGGELNLVPYLDILINTIIFLLATTASVVALANINVNAPRYDGGVSAASDSPTEEDQPKLNLTVAISVKGYVVAGSGGVITGAGGSEDNISVKCMVPLKQDRCPAFLASRINDEGSREMFWVDKYDYNGLTKMMSDIKSKYPHERQVILTADRHVPYKVVIQTMDTLRAKATTKCTGQDGCLFDQVILSAGVQ